MSEEKNNTEEQTEDDAVVLPEIEDDILDGLDISEDVNDSIEEDSMNPFTGGGGQTLTDDEIADFTIGEPDILGESSISDDVDENVDEGVVAIPEAEPDQDEPDEDIPEATPSEVEPQDSFKESSKSDPEPEPEVVEEESKPKPEPEIEVQVEDEDDGPLIEPELMKEEAPVEETPAEEREEPVAEPGPEPVAEPVQTKAPAPSSRPADIPQNITVSTINEWINEGKLNVFFRAYPMIDKFSIRNKAIEILGAYCRQNHIDPLILLAIIESDGAAHKAILKLINEIGRENISEGFQLDIYPKDMRRSMLGIIGKLRIKKMSDQVKNCLNDEDPLVRTAAIQSYIAYRHSPDESVEVIAEILENDDDIRVQFECSKALVAISTLPARKAFEKVVGDREIHPKITQQLEIIRQQVPLEKRKRKDTVFDKGQSPASASSEGGGFIDLSGVNTKQILTLGGVLIAFIFMGIWLYGKWEYYNPRRPNRPPEIEVHEAKNRNN